MSSWSNAVTCCVRWPNERRRWLALLPHSATAQARHSCEGRNLQVSRCIGLPPFSAICRALPTASPITHRAWARGSAYRLPCATPESRPGANTADHSEHAPTLPSFLRRQESRLPLHRAAAFFRRLPGVAHRQPHHPPCSGAGVGVPTSLRCSLLAAGAQPASHSEPAPTRPSFLRRQESSSLPLHQAAAFFRHLAGLPTASPITHRARTRGSAYRLPSGAHGSQRAHVPLATASTPQPARHSCEGRNPVSRCIRLPPFSARFRALPIASPITHRARARGSAYRLPCATPGSRPGAKLPSLRFGQTGAPKSVLDARLARGLDPLRCSARHKSPGG